MPTNTPPDLWNILGALLISTISGFISISNRILDGHKASLLWIISEFLTAILCGYLMYNGYPALEPYIPAWFTLPVAIAVAAHTGGKLFQTVEKEFIRKYTMVLEKRKPLK